MRKLPLIIARLMIVLLVLSGQSTAMAKGMPQSFGTTEICAGQHIVEIAVDAKGRPTAPPHHCLDCTLVALDMMAGELPALFGAASKPAAPILSRHRVIRVTPHYALKARAPPVFV